MVASSETATRGGFPSKGIEWERGRKLFIESPTRPTYAEIAAEIGCAEGSLSRVSADQGWPALRAQFMEAQLVKSDAASAIAEAVKADRTIVHGITSLAIVTIASLTRTVESIKDEQSATTKATALNTAAFAMKNLAEALKAVGVVGLPKALKDGEPAKGFDPKFLVQINNQINSAKEKVDKAEGMTVSVQAVKDADPAQAPPTPPAGGPPPP